MAKREVTRAHAHRIDLRQRQPEQLNVTEDWKRFFLSQPNNSWLCDIPNDYILDRFNTYGLEDKCHASLTFCCKIITGKMTLSNDPMTRSDINEQLPIVYGLIHSRFVLSPDGIQQVYNKYTKGVYGYCPRAKCEKERVLPIGISSQFGNSKVRVFCPCCREVYEARPKINLDGAFFGPNMVHILIDQMNLKKNYENFEPFQHSAFGFKVRKGMFDDEKDEDDI